MTALLVKHELFAYFGTMLTCVLLVCVNVCVYNKFVCVMYAGAKRESDM